MLGSGRAQLAIDAVRVLDVLPVVDRLATVLRDRNDADEFTVFGFAAEGASIAGGLLAAAHGESAHTSTIQVQQALEPWLAAAEKRRAALDAVDPGWMQWWVGAACPRAMVGWVGHRWVVQHLASDTPAVPPEAEAWRPSEKEVDLLLDGLRRLLDEAQQVGTLDEELFGECQLELDRLGTIEGLAPVQAETAVSLLYRWNEITQSHRQIRGRPAGLYPDPTGKYRKRYWDGRAWGAGVGRPRR